MDSMREPNSYALEADKEGNVYVATVGRKNSDLSGRFLQKYKPDGSAWCGIGNYSPYNSEYLWINIAIDNSRDVIYVLFAEKNSEISNAYSYFLTSHQLDNCCRSPSWGETPRFVGVSKVLLAGLDIDTDGNVWTVLEGFKEIPTVPVPVSGLIVKKWAGANGNEIALTNPSWIGTDDRHQRFVAFGIRKSDSRMYIAFKEDPISPETEPIDLVVTFWDERLNFLYRTETSLAIPALDNSTELHHPLFQSGFVNNNGNFLVGGYYSYSRLISEPDDNDTYKFFFPVVLKFDSNLTKLFTYISNSGVRISVNNPYITKVMTKIKPGKDFSIFCYISPLSKMYQVDPSGNEVSHIDLGTSINFGPIEEPPYSNCYYITYPVPYDFVFIPPSESTIVDFGKMVFTGESYGAVPSLEDLADDIVEDLIPDCWPFFYRSITTVSFNLKSKLSRLDDPLKGLEFAWEKTPETFPDWFKKWLGSSPIPVPNPREVSIWNPEPEPEPCPECLRSFSADWKPERLPSYISNIYRAGRPFIRNSRQLDFLDKAADHVAALLKEAPIGTRFTKEMKTSVLRSLEGFKVTRKNAPTVYGKILEAINSVDLDWRIPVLPTKKINIGENITVDFRGVAWITFNKVRKLREISLKVESGLPASADGFATGWPIASYKFDVFGIQPKDDGIDISIYIGGINFIGGISELRVFEWDGKSYKDITTNVDPQRRVITGKTDKLATYVIMGPVPRH
jgi:hypothetical protein